MSSSLPKTVTIEATKFDDKEHPLSWYVSKLRIQARVDENTDEMERDLRQQLTNPEEIRPFLSVDKEVEDSVFSAVNLGMEWLGYQEVSTQAVEYTLEIDWRAFRIRLVETKVRYIYRLDLA